MPPLKTGNHREVQTLFIDFDGEMVDVTKFHFYDPSSGNDFVTLSPLSAFLSNWGFTAEDEDLVIDRILDVIEKSMVEEVKELGGNRAFNIRLLNSRDHRDPFGENNVSRVIVGGTIDELGYSTIGLAESIDVGNFDTSETGITLLDLLSDTDPNNPNSLNNYGLDPSASMIDFVSTVVGKLVAHEAGHFLGNFHTHLYWNQPSEELNIMDSGGILEQTLGGIGIDNIFGTADDTDVSFGPDIFAESEGFTGIENTLIPIVWGATAHKKHHSPERDRVDEKANEFPSIDF